MNQYVALRDPVSWPHQVGTLPRQAACFQHRAAVDALNIALAQDEPLVLIGAGGMGKTQLAAHHARTAWQMRAVDLLVWVTAASRESILTTYAQAGIDVADADPDHPGQAVARFLNWAESTNKRWLVVLDDVADPADLRALWPPQLPQGRTVITTRRRDAAFSGSRIDVGVFTPAEAAAYLGVKLAPHRRQEDPEEIAGLAADLGHLPLALAQVSAYLIDLGLDCAAYRARFASRHRTLSDLFPESGELPDDHHETVGTTWSLSLDHADRIRPQGLSRPLLHLVSVLDPDGIPSAVLTSPPALAYLSECRALDTPQFQGEVSAEIAIDALRALHRLSLATHTPETPQHAVRAHPLIQRVTRESLPRSQSHRLVRTAADALVSAWPEVERDTDLAQVLRSNTDALARHAHEALFRPQVHEVLFRSGDSLGRAGRLSAAVDHFTLLAEDARQFLGPDHRDALLARWYRASWQGEAGDAQGAGQALATLLSDEERVLGKDDTDTLATRQCLARFRGEAGDAAGAVAALTSLMNDQEPGMGPDHPVALTLRHNLAHFRGEAGDTTGAVSALTGLLADRTRVLGPDHPDTFSTRRMLAHWKGRAGDPAAAVGGYRTLLADEERVLGPYHPNTLDTRNQLARWRGEAGDRQGAAAASAELLESVQHALGPDHPYTLSTRLSLARWRGEAGDPAAAVAALVELLAPMRRVLGQDHPDTLATRGQLARFRGKSGDAPGAVGDYAALLADRQRVLGPDHYHTLITRQYLARWRGEAGDAAGAAAALEELLEDQERVLGFSHPHTVLTREHHTGWAAKARSA
ncbi:tetratricopeptide repeat protein [Streptomyces sp. NPDC048172]|uniref:tetratricopeptide repeat protein n=1 Tax=Streptomyces sp. NPDC048172 TaxID=3365505 RepID=UPI00371BF7AB